MDSRTNQTHSMAERTDSNTNRSAKAGVGSFTWNNNRPGRLRMTVLVKAQPTGQVKPSLGMSAGSLSQRALSRSLLFTRALLERHQQLEYADYDRLQLIYREENEDKEPIAVQPAAPSLMSVLYQIKVDLHLHLQQVFGQAFKAGDFKPQARVVKEAVQNYEQSRIQPAGQGLSVSLKSLKPSLKSNNSFATNHIIPSGGNKKTIVKGIISFGDRSKQTTRFLFRRLVTASAAEPSPRMESGKDEDQFTGQKNPLDLREVQGNKTKIKLEQKNQLNVSGSHITGGLFLAPHQHHDYNNRKSLPLIFRTMERSDETELNRSSGVLPAALPIDLSVLRLLQAGFHGAVRQLHAPSPYGVEGSFNPLHLISSRIRTGLNLTFWSEPGKNASLASLFGMGIAHGPAPGAEDKFNIKSTTIISEFEADSSRSHLAGRRLPIRIAAGLSEGRGTRGLTQLSHRAFSERDDSDPLYLTRRSLPIPENGFAFTAEKSILPVNLLRAKRPDRQVSSIQVPDRQISGSATPNRPETDESRETSRFYIQEKSASAPLLSFLNQNQSFRFPLLRKASRFIDRINPLNISGIAASERRSGIGSALTGASRLNLDASVIWNVESRGLGSPISLISLQNGLLQAKPLSDLSSFSALSDREMKTRTGMNKELQERNAMKYRSLNPLNLIARRAVKLTRSLNPGVEQVFEPAEKKSANKVSNKVSNPIFNQVTNKAINQVSDKVFIQKADKVSKQKYSQGAIKISKPVFRQLQNALNRASNQAWEKALFKRANLSADLTLAEIPSLASKASANKGLNQPGKRTIQEKTNNTNKKMNNNKDHANAELGSRMAGQSDFGRVYRGASVRASSVRASGETTGETSVETTGGTSKGVSEEALLRAAEAAAQPSGQAGQATFLNRSETLSQLTFKAIKVNLSFAAFSWGQRALILKKERSAGQRTGRDLQTGLETEFPAGIPAKTTRKNRHNARKFSNESAEIAYVNPVNSANSANPVVHSVNTVNSVKGSFISRFAIKQDHRSANNKLNGAANTSEGAGKTEAALQPISLYYSENSGANKDDYSNWPPASGTYGNQQNRWSQHNRNANRSNKSISWLISSSDTRIQRTGKPLKRSIAQGINAVNAKSSIVNKTSIEGIASKPSNSRIASSASNISSRNGNSLLNSKPVNPLSLSSRQFATMQMHRNDGLRITGISSRAAQIDRGSNPNSSPYNTPFNSVLSKNVNSSSRNATRRTSSSSSNSSRSSSTNSSSANNRDKSSASGSAGIYRFVGENRIRAGNLVFPKKAFSNEKELTGSDEASAPSFMSPSRFNLQPIDAHKSRRANADQGERMPGRYKPDAGIHATEAAASPLTASSLIKLHHASKAANRDGNKPVNRTAETLQTARPLSLVLRENKTVQATPAAPVQEKPVSDKAAEQKQLQQMIASLPELRPAAIADKVFALLEKKIKFEQRRRGL